MKKNFVILTLFTFVFIFTNISEGFGASLPVIPEANKYLYGMTTPAGSGRHKSKPNTNIYKVTNLKDSGPGSLRDGLENALSPKVIVFEVSGNIELKSKIVIDGDSNTSNYITVAGQTAPSPGITLKNYGIKIDRNAHDILIQHIRIRPGDTSFYDSGCPNCEKHEISDPLHLDDHYSASKGWTPPYNIVIDHVSLSWGGDMNFQSGGDKLTFSNNISSEALSNPMHPKGEHSKGGLFKNDSGGVAGSVKVAVVQSLFAHNVDRNVRAAGGSQVIANNLIYDVKFGINFDDDTPNNGPSIGSIVGNYIISTDQTTQCIRLMCGEVAPKSKIYISKDNYYSGATQTDPWGSESSTCMNHQSCFGSGCDSTDLPKANRAAKAADAIWPSGYKTMSAAAAKAYVLANAGARPADRDSVDKRIINQVKKASTKSAIIKSQKDVGGWPNLSKNYRTLNIPKDYNKIQSSGYTKLEEWIHGYSKAVEVDGISVGENSPNPPENLRILSN